MAKATIPGATQNMGGAKMMGYAQYCLDGPEDVRAMIGPEDKHVKLYVHHSTTDATGVLEVEGTSTLAT